MAFQQGLSGLNAASKNLDVIGNNIANSGTYGAKASRAEFADVYAAALNGAGQNQVGIGTTLASVAQQFTQGNITTTENPMDLAINGAGFFQVTDGLNPPLYSRNGQFKVNKEGYIVNNDQLKLMGFPPEETGGTAQPLQLPTGGIDAKTTDTVKIEFTLDSRQKPTAPASGVGIDLKDSTTYNNATSLTVYDAKGQEVALTLYFQRANDPANPSDDVWNVYAMANDTAFDSTGTTYPPGTNPTAPLTVLRFASTGGSPREIGNVSPAGPISIDVPASTSARGYPTLAIAGIQLDLTGANENGSSFSVNDLTQNGYAPGKLTGITVANDGVIQARYSNGQSKPAGRIELATFRNPQGLQAKGGNVWAASSTSGTPIPGKPGDGNMGALQSGALEESNVDLTAELVNMVTAQRAYQANAQTIKTQDQVLQTIVNLR